MIKECSEWAMFLAFQACHRVNVGQKLQYAPFPSIPIISRQHYRMLQARKGIRIEV